MSKREDQAFEAWLKDIKATLSEAEIPGFESFAASEAGREVFRGSLRETEFYTRLNKLNSEKEDFEAEKDVLAQSQTELAEWYESEEPIREALIKERDELRRQAAEKPKDGDGAGDPPNQFTGVSPEEFALIRAKASKVDAIDKLLPKVLGDLGAVLQDAQKNDFDVDAREVMQLSVKEGIEPYRAYDILTADQRSTREAEKVKEEQKHWFEEGRRAALSGDAPDHISPTTPSMFDVLSTPEPTDGNASVAKTSGMRVNEAVAAFRDGDF